MFLTLFGILQKNPRLIKHDPKILSTNRTLSKQLTAYTPGKCICDGDCDPSYASICSGSVNLVTDFTDGVGYIIKKGSYEVDRTAFTDDKFSNNKLVIYLMDEDISLTIKNSKSLTLERAVNPYDYWLSFFTIKSSTCDDLQTLISSDRIVIVSPQERTTLNTITVEATDDYSFGYVLYNDVTDQIGSLGFNIIMDFKAQKKLLPFLIPTDREFANKQCYDINAAHNQNLIQISSNPSIYITGSLSNRNPIIGRFFHSYDCICENSGCPNSLCTILTSIDDIIGEGYIFKKGNYEIDLSKNYHYIQYADNIGPALNLDIGSTDITLTIKKSKSFGFSLEIGEQYENEFSFSTAQWTCENFLSVTEKNVKIGLLSGKSSGNKIVVEADSDYSLMFPSPAEGQTINFGIPFTINFKSSGKLSSFMLDLSQGNTLEEACSAVTLKNYKSEPTFNIQGSLSNSDDVGTFANIIKGNDNGNNSDNNNSNNNNNNKDNKNDKLSGGAIAGIVIGCVVVVAVIVVVVIIVLKKKKDSGKEDPAV